MIEELLAVCVLWWAVGVVAIMLVWVFLIRCGDLMKAAWQAMEGREWRWPEGTGGVYGPCDEPYKRQKK
jgi:hypothetical protein